MINNRMARSRQAFYNNTTSKPERPAGNTKELQKKLQKISFALVETVLYLDAYPNCEKAKNYYRELKKERESILKALTEAGMPMNAMAVEGGEWSWINGPWPWEYEANV